jgi:glucosamine--fructose-6-phosphate aminotransferase (isomerizing)
LEIAIANKATVAGIVNRVGSSIARLAGCGMYLHAGDEIGVASTKAFSCQVRVFFFFFIFLVFYFFKIKKKKKKK